MKNRKSYALIALCLLCVCWHNSQGQAASNEADLSSFLQAESQDASKLIGAYISPVIKGFSYGATSGWYHTAQTHKKLGIDLGVTLVAVMMPSSENTFSPQSLGLSSNTTPNFTGDAPTILGPKTPTSYDVSYTQGAQTVSTTIAGPEGLDFNKNIGFSAVPAAMIQLGIGTIKNTDLKIRFLPEINKGASHVKMLGFGLMHDIKQYIPGVKALPFDLSVLLGYNSISGSTSLLNTDQSNDGRPYTTNGTISYKLDSWVAQAVISKKLAIVTFYLGIGYGSVNTNANISGSFTLDPFITGLTIQNPFNTTYSNSSVKLTTGIRFKFGPIYLNTDYTLQQYNAISLGLGCSIR